MQKTSEQFVQVQPETARLKSGLVNGSAVVQTADSTKSDANAARTPSATVAQKAKRSRRYWTISLGLVALIVLMTLGIVPRVQRSMVLEAETAEVKSARPRVGVTRVERAPEVSDLTLPGNIRAFLDTPVYARTNGYLRRFLVEIGDHVREGQLLGEIETPEIDQELRQSRATLEQSRAALAQAQVNLDIARITMERWRRLIQRKAVTQQELDDREATFRARLADVESAQANVHANEANVRRLTELQSFERVVAPFDGIVTARNVDNGALIASGNNSSGRELFRVAKTDPLRIYVYVPQTFSPFMRAGLEAKVMVRELPEREFPGVVVRDAGALDPTSRTLLTEVQVRNPESRIFPGMYAEVTFAIPRTSPPLMIPASALIIRAQGPQVAVVRHDGTVHLQKIELGRDYGMRIEVTGGLDGSEIVVTTPTDEVQEGVAVEPITPKTSDTKGAPPAQTGAANQTQRKQ
jgi:RND family efflux transporter MFP subunit